MGKQEGAPKADAPEGIVKKPKAIVKKKAAYRSVGPFTVKKNRDPISRLSSSEKREATARLTAVRDRLDRDRAARPVAKTASQVTGVGKATASSGAGTIYKSFRDA